MCEYKDGHELCGKCSKPYVALLAKDSCNCPLQVVINHKGEQIESAAVLKATQRARVAEELNKGIQKENQRMRGYLYGLYEGDGNIEQDEVYEAIYGKKEIE